MRLSEKPGNTIGKRLVRCVCGRQAEGAVAAEQLERHQALVLACVGPEELSDGVHLGQVVGGEGGQQMLQLLQLAALRARGGQGQEHPRGLRQVRVVELVNLVQRVLVEPDS